MLALLTAAQDVLLTQEGIQVAPTALALVLGTVLPLVTALLANVTAPSKVKATINTVLAVVGATVVYLQAHEGKVTWAQLIICIAAAFGASGVSYNHFWKALNIPQVLAIATKHFGLGKDKPLLEIIDRANVTGPELKKALNHPLGFQRSVTAIVEQKLPN
jgi:hypothetical protein